LGAVVPPALDGGGVDNWSHSRRDSSITVSLESPSHVSIVRVRREVFSGIAVSTIGPGLALVDDSLSSRNENGDLVTSFVGCSNVVFLGASIANFSKRSEYRRCSRSDRSLTVSDQSPSEVVLVARLELRAVFRLVNIARALIDNRVGVGDSNCNLVTCFVFGSIAVGVRTSIVIGQSAEGGSRSRSNRSFTVSYNFPTKLGPVSRLKAVTVTIVWEGLAFVDNLLNSISFNRHLVSSLIGVASRVVRRTSTCIS
jgi:hypothetical protein